MARAAQHAAPRRRGTHHAWVGIATDVTERKVLEKEARSAKELLVRALEEGKMYLFQFELEGGRIDLARNTIVNVWSSLGFEAPPSARPFAETLAVLVLPEDQAMLAEAVRAAIAGETPAYEVSIGPGTRMEPSAGISREDRGAGQRRNAGALHGVERRRHGAQAG